MVGFSVPGPALIPLMSSESMCAVCWKDFDYCTNIIRKYIFAVTKIKLTPVQWALKVGPKIRDTHQNIFTCAPLHHSPKQFEAIVISGMHKGGGGTRLPIPHQSYLCVLILEKRTFCSYIRYVLINITKCISQGRRHKTLVTFVLSCWIESCITGKMDGSITKLHVVSANEQFTSYCTSCNLIPSALRNRSTYST